MTAFVLDASTALGWILDRPVPAAASHARDLIVAGAVPVVPSLWAQEVSNGIVMAERRGRLTTVQVAAIAIDIEELLQIAEVEAFVARPVTLIDLAQRTGLTVYDVTYLELASRRRLALATLDDKLREAAKRATLSLI